MSASTGSSSSQQASQMAPPPWASSALQQSLQTAQSLQQMPFEIAPQPIAPFQPQQEQAFQTVENLQGAYSPFLEAGLMGLGQLAQQGAGFETPWGATQYFGAESAGVLPELENIFGQQMAQTTGDLTNQAGGTDAERIAVGQGILANQQGLSAGQTLSQLMGQAVGQGQAAGTNLAAIGNQSAGTAGQLASTGQQMGLTGAQAALNAGTAQQQQLQNIYNSLYQNTNQAISWPFQTNAYLASLASGLTPPAGGTMTQQGQTKSSNVGGSAKGIGGGLAGLGGARGGRVGADSSSYDTGGRIPMQSGGKGGGGISSDISSVHDQLQGFKQPLAGPAGYFPDWTYDPAHPERIPPAADPVRYGAIPRTAYLYPSTLPPGSQPILHTRNNEFGFSSTPPQSPMVPEFQTSENILMGSPDFSNQVGNSPFASSIWSGGIGNDAQNVLTPLNNTTGFFPKVPTQEEVTGPTSASQTDALASLLMERQGLVAQLPSSPFAFGPSAGPSGPSSIPGAARSAPAPAWRGGRYAGGGRIPMQGGGQPLAQAPVPTQPGAFPAAGVQSSAPTFGINNFPALGIGKGPGQPSGDWGTSDPSGGWFGSGAATPWGMTANANPANQQAWWGQGNFPVTPKLPQQAAQTPWTNPFNQANPSTWATEMGQTLNPFASNPGSPFASTGTMGKGMAAGGRTPMQSGGMGGMSMRPGGGQTQLASIDPGPQDAQPAMQSGPQVTSLTNPSLGVGASLLQDPTGRVATPTLPPREPPWKQLAGLLQKQQPPQKGGDGGGGGGKKPQMPGGQKQAAAQPGQQQTDPNATTTDPNATTAPATADPTLPASSTNPFSTGAPQIPFTGDPSGDLPIQTAGMMGGQPEGLGLLADLTMGGGMGGMGGGDIGGGGDQAQVADTGGGGDFGGDFGWRGGRFQDGGIPTSSTFPTPSTSFNPWPMMAQADTAEWNPQGGSGSDDSALAQQRGGAIRRAMRLARGGFDNGGPTDDGGGDGDVSTPSSPDTPAALDSPDTPAALDLQREFELFHDYVTGGKEPWSPVSREVEDGRSAPADQTPIRDLARPAETPFGARSHLYPGLAGPTGPGGTALAGPSLGAQSGTSPPPLTPSPAPVPAPVRPAGTDLTSPLFQPGPVVAPQVMDALQRLRTWAAPGPGSPQGTQTTAMPGPQTQGPGGPMPWTSGSFADRFMPPGAATRRAIDLSQPQGGGPYAGIPYAGIPGDVSRETSRPEEEAVKDTNEAIRQAAGLPPPAPRPRPASAPGWGQGAQTGWGPNGWVQYPPSMAGAVPLPRERPFGAPGVAPPLPPERPLSFDERFAGEPQPGKSDRLVSAHPFASEPISQGEQPSMAPPVAPAAIGPEPQRGGLPSWMPPYPRSPAEKAASIANQDPALQFGPPVGRFSSWPPQPKPAVQPGAPATASPSADIRSRVSNQWLQEGATPTAIAGILPNIHSESSFNPAMRHWDPTAEERASGNRGEYTFARGLYSERGVNAQRYDQWRQQNAPNSAWNDPVTQTRFTAWNLKNNYPGTWQRMNAARTPNDAAVIFLREYLAPAQQHQINRAAQYRRMNLQPYAKAGRVPMQDAGTPDQPPAPDDDQRPRQMASADEPPPLGTQPAFQDLEPNVIHTVPIKSQPQGQITKPPPPPAEPPPTTTTTTAAPAATTTSKPATVTRPTPPAANDPRIFATPPGAETLSPWQKMMYRVFVGPTAPEEIERARLGLKSAFWDLYYQRQKDIAQEDITGYPADIATRQLRSIGATKDGGKSFGAEGAGEAGVSTTSPVAGAAAPALAPGSKSAAGTPGAATPQQAQEQQQLQQQIGMNAMEQEQFRRAWTNMQIPRSGGSEELTNLLNARSSRAQQAAQTGLISANTARVMVETARQGWMPIGDGMSHYNVDPRYDAGTGTPLGPRDPRRYINTMSLYRDALAAQSGQPSSAPAVAAPPTEGLPASLLSPQPLVAPLQGGVGAQPQTSAKPIEADPGLKQQQQREQERQAWLKSDPAGDPLQDHPRLNTPQMRDPASAVPPVNQLLDEKGRYFNPYITAPGGMASQKADVERVKNQDAAAAMKARAVQGDLEMLRNVSGDKANRAWTNAWNNLLDTVGLPRSEYGLPEGKAEQIEMMQMMSRKLSLDVGAGAGKGVGAGRIMGFISKSLPDEITSPEVRKAMFAGMYEEAQRAIDHSEFMNKYINQSGGMADMAAGERLFDEQFPVKDYALRAAVRGSLRLKNSDLQIAETSTKQREALRDAWHVPAWAINELYKK